MFPSVAAATSPPELVRHLGGGLAGIQVLCSRSGDRPVGGALQPGTWPDGGMTQRDSLADLLLRSHTKIPVFLEKKRLNDFCVFYILVLVCAFSSYRWYCVLHFILFPKYYSAQYFVFRI